MGDEVTLHPELGPLGDLLGTWEGHGAGDYPTIEPFRYGERVTFGHVGKPFLSYQQRTWDAETGAPLHAECGYLRALGRAVPVEADASRPAEVQATPALVAAPIRVELVLAHPTGVAEVEEGELADGVLQLASTSIGLTSSAKPVRSLRREFRLEGDELTYDLWMAHAETPETHHLHAALNRVG